MRGQREGGLEPHETVRVAHRFNQRIDAFLREAAGTDDLRQRLDRLDRNRRIVVLQRAGQHCIDVLAAGVHIEVVGGKLRAAGVLSFAEIHLALVVSGEPEAEGIGPSAPQFQGRARFAHRHPIVEDRAGDLFGAEAVPFPRPDPGGRGRCIMAEDDVAIIEPLAKLVEQVRHVLVLGIAAHRLECIGGGGANGRGTVLVLRDTRR